MQTPSQGRTSGDTDRPDSRREVEPSISRKHNFKGSWKAVLLSKSPDFLKSEAYAERFTRLYGVQLNLKLYWA